MDRNEIIKALKTIQKVCSEADKCALCPLRRNEDYCMLEANAPVHWNIAEEENWRAFN